MCLVVQYSEKSVKSVKSDYLGVIICIWWRKVRKIRIFAKPKHKIHCKFIRRLQKIWIFTIKSHSLSIFQAEYTKKLGHSFGFFRKIGKFIQLAVQLTSNLTICGGESSKKSQNSERIFNNIYLQIICCSIRVQI